MTKPVFILILILTSLLAGCATGYQSAGLTGGYKQIPGPGKLDKVFFFGNGYITANTVKDYALYRVAEVAQSKNKPHFVIYQTLVGAARDIAATGALVGVVDNKPVAYAFVLYLDAPRQGSMETAAVLKQLDWVQNPPQTNAGNGGTK